MGRRRRSTSIPVFGRTEVEQDIADRGWMLIVKVRVKVKVKVKVMLRAGLGCDAMRCDAVRWGKMWVHGR
jgi:hypothetical protein